MWNLFRATMDSLSSWNLFGNITDPFSETSQFWEHHGLFITFNLLYSTLYLLLRRYLSHLALKVFQLHSLDPSLNINLAPLPILIFLLISLYLYSFDLRLCSLLHHASALSHPALSHSGPSHLSKIRTPSSRVRVQHIS